MVNAKGKFEIVIKNNENGETILSQNTNGIMMALSEEEGVRQLILTNSTTAEIIHMMKALNDIITIQKNMITAKLLSHIKH